jgi:hypothetical protein
MFEATAFYLAVKSRWETGKVKPFGGLTLPSDHCARRRFYPSDRGCTEFAGYLRVIHSRASGIRGSRKLAHR